MRDDNLSANDVPLYVGGDIASGLPVYVFPGSWARFPRVMSRSSSPISNVRIAHHVCMRNDSHNKLLSMIVLYCTFTVFLFFTDYFGDMAVKCFFTFLAIIMVAIFKWGATFIAEVCDKVKAFCLERCEDNAVADLGNSKGGVLNTIAGGLGAQPPRC